MTQHNHAYGNWAAHCTDCGKTFKRTHRCRVTQVRYRVVGKERIGITAGADTRFAIPWFGYNDL